MKEQRRITRCAGVGNPAGDDLLRRVFTACHPVLSSNAQVALNLKLVCGLDTDGFLTPAPFKEIVRL